MNKGKENVIAKQWAHRYVIQRNDEDEETFYESDRTYIPCDSLTFRNNAHVRINITTYVVRRSYLIYRDYFHGNN